MKTTRTNTLALFLLPVLMVLSCSKDIPSNPQEMDFAAASFSFAQAFVFVVFPQQFSMQ